jgi:hypothetical protein
MVGLLNGRVVCFVVLFVLFGERLGRRPSSYQQCVPHDS